jgi:glycolate oxidase FAD binding subunit
VIKNVAGYDLGKLFTGSRGTLGLIAVLAVRLHPRPERTTTLEVSFDDPRRLAEAVARLAARPLEADSLDAAWERGRGSVLVRFSGATAGERAAKVGEPLGAAVFEDDAAVWERQRTRQRLSGGVVAKVAHLITDLERVLRAADQAGALHVVSRAGLGVSWVALPGGADAEARIDALRHELPGVAVTVLDGAASVRTPWPDVDSGALAVMERVKARFDPARVFAPGAFVGGV